VTSVAIAAALAELSQPELACLELAWEAQLAGTIPIGAVVTDADGQIVARGRNAVFGSAQPPWLSGTRLAHAEINALIGLPREVPNASLRLVTSVEPCQLCTGAARMSTVGALTYLGADPVNGTAWALESDRYVGHRPVTVTGPREDQVGRLASAMALAFSLVRKPGAAFLTVYRQRRPDLAAAAEALLAAGVQEMAQQQMSWNEAAPILLAAV
jgi:tRNA(Arg) A34 adenosine deaminase TadA